MLIKGQFSVKLQPLDTYGVSKAGNKLARMSIDKTFQGPLSGTSQGDMLSAMTSKQGSAGYVAIELVTGEIEGKAGSFCLQHFGLMSNGEQSLTLCVVPDSGTGELEGLSGTMEINIIDGEHYYAFDYQLTN